MGWGIGMNTQFRVGDVVRTTARLCGRKAGVFLGLALIGSVPGWAVSAIALLLLGGGPVSLAPGLLLFLLQFAALAAGNGWSAAAIAYYAVRTLRAETPPFGEVAVQAVRKTPDVVATYALASLALSLGAFVFVVPGIVLWLMFYVAVPAAAVEGGVIAALRRSHELTNGHKWALLGVFALWLLATLAIVFMGALALVFGAPNVLIQLGGSAIILVVPWALWGVVGAASYYHLRLAAEG